MMQWDPSAIADSTGVMRDEVDLGRPNNDPMATRLMIIEKGPLIHSRPQMKG
jgi:hypothetical protein